MLHQAHFTLQNWLRLRPIMIGLLLLASGVVMSACGDDEDTGVEAVSSSHNNNQQDQTDESAGSNTTSPETIGWDFDPETSDRLVFVQGEELYITSLGGEEPQLMAEGLHPPTIALTPQGDHLTFNARTTRWYVHRTRLDTLETRQIVRVSSEYAFVGAWSPDADSLFIFNFPTLLLAGLDGSNHRIGQFGLNQGTATPFWLADGTALVVQQDAQGTVTEIKHIDPATGEEMEIDPAGMSVLGDAFPTGGNVTVEDQFAFQNAIEETLGVPIAPQAAVDPEALPAPAFQGPPPGIAGSIEICGTWQLVEGEDVIYEIEDSLFLSNLNALADGSFVFLRWYLDECDNNQREVDMIYISPEGESRVLIDSVDFGISNTYQTFFANTGPRMSVTSDERYVAWLGGGFDLGLSTLNITDLATGQTIELAREERTAGNSSTFHLEDAFTAVLWVP